MELPAALTPWRESLELLDPAAALTLGPLLQRLDLAIGPFSRYGRGGEGDPDGFSGIARRGTYERLLISEWLLAEELPEEFTRRALAGEHAFLQLARRSPAGEQQCTALFDAGPDQWGAPRLAHLATLLVLERRARAAGITFRWGVLQDDEHRLLPALSEASIRRLLAMRSSAPATAGLFSGWSTRLGDATAPRQELWLIGGRRAVALAGPRTSSVRLSEALEPGPAQLEAVVVKPQAAPRSVALPLPDEPTQVRLLRDPFTTAVAAPQRTSSEFAPASNLVFSATGNKLFARSRDGALIAYPIPNSPQAGVGKPRHLRPRQPGVIVAVGRTRKLNLALLHYAETGSLNLDGLGSSHARIPTGPLLNCGGLPLSEDPDPPLQPLLGLWSNSEPELFALVQGLLLRITRTHSYQNSAHRHDSGVQLLAPAGDGLTYVKRSDDQWVKTSRTWEGTETRIVRAHAGRRVLGGCGGSFSQSAWGLCGLEMSDPYWSVESGEAIWQIYPPAGTQVIGVTGPMKYGDSPAVVVLEADRVTINVLGLNWAHRLPPASSEIEHVTISSVASHIAYATVRGEVVVYSLAHTSVLFRLTTTGEVS